MTTEQFTGYVRRVAKAMSLFSDEGEPISELAIKAANSVLSNIDDITAEDKYLIAVSAKLLVECDGPIDINECKAYRGHAIFKGHNHKTNIQYLVSGEINV